MSKLHRIRPHSATFTSEKLKVFRDLDRVQIPSGTSSDSHTERRTSRVWAVLVLLLRMAGVPVWVPKTELERCRPRSFSTNPVTPDSRMDPPASWFVAVVLDGVWLRPGLAQTEKHVLGHIMKMRLPEFRLTLNRSRPTAGLFTRSSALAANSPVPCVNKKSRTTAPKTCGRSVGIGQERR